MKEHNKIKNKHYLKFLDEGIIELVEKEHIAQALGNVKGRLKISGRSLLITLYLTGARPNEVLRLKSEDIGIDKSFITIKMKASKGGVPRTIYLRKSNPFAKELFQYSKSIFPGMFLFHAYWSTYKRRVIVKGEVVYRLDISNKLRHYFNKWFYGILEIPPYYLRHSRFSGLTLKGVGDNELRLLKGSKTFESIRAYQHMSVKRSKSIARYID